MHALLNTDRKHCKKWVTEEEDQDAHKVHHQESIQESTRMGNLRRHNRETQGGTEGQERFCPDREQPRSASSHWNTLRAFLPLSAPSTAAGNPYFN